MIRSALVFFALATALAIVPPAGADHLPATGYFVDDDGTTHEADIDSIAAAGITVGCVPEAALYCPGDTVTRGQMAAFLRRALALPTTNIDYFTDDGESIFAEDIDAIAAAGITVGCVPTGGLYCPDDDVTRAQMASFLTRALGLPPVFLHADLDLAVPFSGLCGLEQVICASTLELPQVDEYVIDEGWFYAPPYADGDADVFADPGTEFTVTLDGVPLELTVHPVESVDGLDVKRFETTLTALRAGSHRFVGRWFWGGELLYTTDLTVIIE